MSLLTDLAQDLQAWTQPWLCHSLPLRPWTSCLGFLHTCFPSVRKWPGVLKGSWEDK